MPSAHPIENVWDYPRPPQVEPVPWPIRVEHAGIVVVEAPEAHRVLETTHPPVYYVGREHARMDLLRPSAARTTYCEWKGRASYFDLVIEDAVVPSACWSYPEPTARFASIRNALAFYPGKVDACFVDGERVQAQPGDFYGGWVTPWIDGGERGFKGGPGTLGW